MLSYSAVSRTVRNCCLMLCPLFQCSTADLLEVVELLAIFVCLQAFRKCILKVCIENEGQLFNIKLEYFFLYFGSLPQITRLCFNFQ